jgi:outer membrane protein OmpA-like peptidoglycan-associated protein
MRSFALFGGLLVALAVMPAAPAAAGHWYFTPLAGQMFYDDSLGAGPAKRVLLQDALFFGGRLGWQFQERWGVQIGGGSAGAESDRPGLGDVDVQHGSVDVTFSPLVAEKGDLYLLLGGGGAHYKAEGVFEKDYGSFDVGAGGRWWLNEWLGLAAEARSIMLLEDNIEASKFNNVLVAGGVNFRFGGKQADADGDGVSDKKDTCPGTPPGAVVDATGCPTDADGDGVFDGLDTCPDTPGGATVDAKGCPTDSDGDGAFDGLDQCADTPKGATVDARGCPTDSDGDGVFDGIDTCPNTPKGATVNTTGCPTDTDGDGVLDGLDKCPDTPPGTEVTLMGCPPAVQERATELLDTGMIRMQNVNFETGKAVLTQESQSALDDVGYVLSRWNQLKFEVGGHTDSRGSAQLNQKLSEQRAQAAIDYLNAKFKLAPDQLVAKGYGESKPLAPNNNALNMAKNRRVEFVVLNKEQLKREVKP